MSKTTNKTSSIIEVLIVLLILFCLLADAVFIYYKFFMPKRITEDVAYIGSITDINENKKAIFEIEYYENADKSGVELLDIKTNYLTDYEKNDIYSSGIQFVGKPKFEWINPYTMDLLYRTNRTQLYVNDNVYFYNIDSTNNIAYERDTRITNKESFTITIGEDIYKLAFKEEIFDTGIAHTSYKIENIYSFSKSIYEGINGLSYGTHPITFKFQDMFEIFKFNENNKKFEDATDAETFITYVYINVTKHREGATTYDNSIFKSIAGNSNWIFENADVTKEYATNETFYKLTENDMVFNYDNEKGYHIGSLNKNAYDTFKETKIKLKLVINQDNLTEKTIYFGELDTTYLEDLGITTYTLIENGQKSEVEVC